MGECYIVRRGGSGGGSVRVVGGLSQPTSKNMSTIWVKTDKPVKQWCLRADPPKDPVENLVWVRTGITSKVPIILSKKNPTYIYPLNASQYIGGIWVPKDAKSYNGSSWVSWIQYFYNKGTFSDSFPRYEYRNDKYYKIQYDPESILFRTNGQGVWAGAVVFGPITAGMLSTIHVTGEFGTYRGGFMSLYIAKTNNVPFDGGIKYVSVKNVDEESPDYKIDLTLDVSDVSDDYYIFAGLDTHNTTYGDPREARLFTIIGEP